MFPPVASNCIAGADEHFETEEPWVMITADGFGLTVTVTDVEDEQVPSVAVTV